MKKFLVMIVLLVLIGLVTTPAQAASVHQSLTLGGFQVSLSGQEGGGQDGDGVWLSAQVASSIHLVDYVSATFYHPSEGDENEWGWTASFGGIKNSSLVLSPIWSSSGLSVGGVSLSQITQLSSESGYDRGWASVTVDPSRLDFAYMNYAEWYDEYIDGVRWNAYFIFRGNFGDGELGEARGRGYFGLTPEPATMALLGPAVLFFARRRR
ncbi:PEP-CTERM sorting domain-containing protein [Candidatus Nomurabacteria bacterium]|nr:PEP-CTERM sorting domain-containing protein [Candidatus Nomurabacteria bacterium]